MGSRDHSCEGCGRSGMNDDRPCICPRLAEGTAPGNAYSPMPGDLCEVRSQFLVKHYDAHGVRLGTVDKNAGPGAWWVVLPGYAKSIRFETNELALVYRPMKEER